MKELHALEAPLGHRFAEPALLEQALTHASVRHEQQTGGEAALQPPVADNERLEFLGDAIVGMVVGALLYRRYPELHEGELTRLRAALVSRKHLGLVGTQLGLSTHLRLGRAEERNGGRRKAVLLANCMEALIGALYLEGGLPIAAAFIERTVAEPYIDELRGELRENRAIGDYKTALQELLQARRVGQPVYTTQAESGPDHRKHFVVEVSAAGAQAGAPSGANNGTPKAAGEPGLLAQGEGGTKKQASQEAARLLYERLISAGAGTGSIGHRAPSPSLMETQDKRRPAGQEHPRPAVDQADMPDQDPNLAGQRAGHGDVPRPGDAKGKRRQPRKKLA